MKLTYFSIRDYRSIGKAQLDNLQSSTILIGPNNEGKSNVLQGLNACLTLLRTDRPIRSGEKLQLRYDRESFDWSTDYPVRKQLANKTGESVFELHFQLSESEQAAFHGATGSKLNDVLPIQVSFGPNQFASFKVLKQGRGGVALSKKPDPICRFIARTLDFAYIPAIRTANASLEVVNELVSRELRQLEKNDRYANLQKEMLELQKPVLEGIAAKLKTNLQGFLGAGLRDVTLSLADRYTEDQLVEQLAVGLFVELGWSTVPAVEEVFGATGTLGRETPGEGTVVPRLRAAGEQLNPRTPPESISMAVGELVWGPFCRSWNKSTANNAIMSLYE